MLMKLVIKLKAILKIKFLILKLQFTLSQAGKMYLEIQKLMRLPASVDGVKGIHNISSYSSNGKIFVSLHVMVERKINLEKAHKISEIIENKIQDELPEIHHVTIHLEPFITIPEKMDMKGSGMEKKISKILEDYSEIKKIGRIVIFKFKNVLKIDIDCSFDKNLSIEKVHDLTSQIEHKIRDNYKNSIIIIHPEPL